VNSIGINVIAKVQHNIISTRKADYGGVSFATTRGREKKFRAARAQMRKSSNRQLGLGGAAKESPNTCLGKEEAVKNPHS